VNNAAILYDDDDDLDRTVTDLERRLVRRNQVATVSKVADLFTGMFTPNTNTHRKQKQH